MDRVFKSFRELMREHGDNEKIRTKFAERYRLLQSGLGIGYIVYTTIRDKLMHHYLKYTDLYGDSPEERLETKDAYVQLIQLELRTVFRGLGNEYAQILLGPQHFVNRLIKKVTLDPNEAKRRVAREMINMYWIAVYPFPTISENADIVELFTASMAEAVEGPTSINIGYTEDEDRPEDVARCEIIVGIWLSTNTRRGKVGTLADVVRGVPESNLIVLMHESILDNSAEIAATAYVPAHVRMVRAEEVDRGLAESMKAGLDALKFRAEVDSVAGVTRGRKRLCEYRRHTSRVFEMMSDFQRRAPDRVVFVRVFDDDHAARMVDEHGEYAFDILKTMVGSALITVLQI